MHDKISKWLNEGIKSGFIKESFNEPLIEEFNEKNFPNIFIDPEGNKFNLMGGGDRGQKKLVSELEAQHGEGSGIAHGLLAQKIYYLNKDNIIEIKNEPAYVLEFKDTKAEKRITVAMKDKNGVPRKISFNLEDIADDISGLRRSRMKEAVTMINKVLSDHNKVIEKMTDRGGVQTLPLRFNAAIGKIDKRLSDLESQFQHFSQIASEEHRTPQISEMEEKATKGLASLDEHIFANTKNVVTALLNMYAGKEQQLIDDINNGKFSQVPDIAMSQAKRYAQSIVEKYQEKQRKDQERDLAREERQEDIDVDVDMPDTPFPELTTEDVPMYTPEKATGFRSDSARSSQARRVLKTIQRDISELKSVKDAAQGLQGFIANLSSATEDDLSQLSRQYLSDPANKFDVDSMKDFVSSSKSFFRRYQTNVWSDDGLPDKSKLGRIGFSGVANFLIALDLKKVTTSFDIIMSSYAGSNF
jgi:hypothetical protein